MKEKIRNIWFEYFLVANMLAISFVAYKFISADNIGYYFAFVMFIVYLRHHHIGEKVVIERVSKNIVSSRAIEGRKFPRLLDIPFFAIGFLFISGIIVNYYICAGIFLAWFIFTDIFRVRRCIYGRYISRWFGTSKIDINGSKWRLHKSDVDSFPSVPHMHPIDNRPLSLNIYTGEIYNKTTRKIVETAHKKDLKKLWSDEKLKKLILEAREIYLKNNPNYKLQDLPKFD